MANADDPVLSRPAPEAIVADLIEVDAAVRLVAVGQARRVRLVGLSAPERIAATALARAQAADLAFRVEKTDTSVFLTIGPRLGRP